jgi:hypothetical protein
MSSTDIDVMYWMGFLIGLLGFFTSILIASVIHNGFRRPEKITGVTQAQQVIERKNEIRRLTGQILTGQSAAIVSVFEDDRTKILGHLDDPSNNEELYGEHANGLIFSKLDINSFLLENGKDKCESYQFWEQALKPLENKIETDSSLDKIYQTCKKNQFDKFYLDSLITQLKPEGLRLVLMLDRFDELLNSNLDKPIFFATLRELASSRNPSSLSLIISGDISLKQFHEETKNEGSPFLNFMESCEITLRSLSDNEVDILLREEDFSKKERQFIKEITGGHVYFIQLAISALKDAKENKESLEVARKEFCTKVETYIINSLNSKVYQTIITIANGEKVPDSLNDEIDLLKKQGLVKKDNDNNWQVSPSILVDCIGNKTEQELCNS